MYKINNIEHNTFSVNGLGKMSRIVYVQVQRKINAKKC